MALDLSGKLVFKFDPVADIEPESLDKLVDLVADRVIEKLDARNPEE